MTHKKIILSSALLIFAYGCGTVTVTTPEPVTLPEFVTATLPATAIPLPTQTDTPPTAAPTLPPTQGTTTTQVNVRTETTTASQSFGVIPAFTVIQIFAKDPTGTWYRIQYEGAPNGAGWVRAEFVQADPKSIQTWALPAGSASGLVISGINVRSGPGKDYDSLGVLTPKDVVLITGKDATGGWLQFDFPGGPDGKGWAAAEYLQVENVASLPTMGETVVEATAKAGQTPVSSEVLIASADGDSMAAPLARVTLSPGAARMIEVRGEVSNPEGDREDWIAFTSSRTRILLGVQCEQGVLQVEVWQAGALAESLLLSCGDKVVLSVTANVEYQLKVSLPSAGRLRFRLRAEVGE